jgi:hypothetical protein
MTAYSTSSDPVSRIFGEWLDLTGQSPARTKMGPTRRAAIAAWLQVYGEDMLMEAMVGAAACEFIASARSPRVRCITWVLQSEASIEDYAEKGRAIQARAATQPVRPAAEAAAPPSAEEVERAAQARAKLRGLVRQMSGRPGDE